MRRAGLFLTLAAAAGVLSCGRATRRPDVVVVSIDTLRADRLPAYGYRAGATPAIDGLRRESVLFSDATTSCPLTLPAHATLFTGSLPPRHGVRDNAGYTLDRAAPETLAQRLALRGYETAGFVSAGVLDASTGISRGFQTWDDAIARRADRSAASETQRSGAETVARALSWLDGRAGKTPFLLFVHLYEPHAPYAPPEPYASRFASAYDGEVAAADAAVGSLLEGLRKRGLFEPAEILVLSDHGEGLSDHGEEEHGILLYREALHVPLIWKRAGAKQPAATIREPVSLADVLPTLLGIAGAPSGPRLGDGVDLFGSAARLQARRHYAETFYPRVHLGWSDLASSWDGRWHYIDGPQPELYDVASDPRETRNLFGERREIAAESRRFLDGLRTPYAAPGAADAEQLARLTALGYLTGAAPPREGPLANPKDALPELARMRTAFRLDAEGKRSEAAALLAEVLARHPDFFDARWKLASILAALGQDAEAEREIRRAIALAPSRAAEMADLLGRVLARQEKLPEAEAAARLAATRPERRAFAAVVLADVALRRGDPAAALAALDGTPPGEPAPRGWHLVRGEALARQERPEEAEREFRREIELYPASSEAWAGLAILRALRGDRVADVRALLEKMHEANPGPPAARLAQRTLARLGDSAGAASWSKRAS
jgi:arylsulfatase A-like enzyme/Flp pilus assembly protein TadD